MLLLSVSQQYMSQVPSVHFHFIKAPQAHGNIWKRSIACGHLLKLMSDSKTRPPGHDPAFHTFGQTKHSFLFRSLLRNAGVHILKSLICALQLFGLSCRCAG